MYCGGQFAYLVKLQLAEALCGALCSCAHICTVCIDCTGHCVVPRAMPNIVPGELTELRRHLIRFSFARNAEH